MGKREIYSCITLQKELENGLYFLNGKNRRDLDGRIWKSGQIHKKYH